MRKIDEYKVNLLQRAKSFGIKIIKFSTKFPKNAVGFTIVDQLVRSATSIGSNLIEAQEAVSNNDFLYKISFSLKEAKEAKYWLELSKESLLNEDEELVILLRENEEIVKILVLICIKLKNKKFHR